MRFIRGGHALPDSISFRVSPFVVKLGRDDENDVVGGEGQENFVSRAVQGFVLVTINLSSVICQCHPYSSCFSCMRLKHSPSHPRIKSLTLEAKIFDV